MEGLSMNNTLTRARNESRIKPLPIIIVIAALALLVVLNVVVDGKFLTFQNFTIILSAATVPAFVAWGFSYLFACGHHRPVGGRHHCSGCHSLRHCGQCARLCPHVHCRCTGRRALPGRQYDALPGHKDSSLDCRPWHDHGLRDHRRLLLTGTGISGPAGRGTGR